MEPLGVLCVLGIVLAIVTVVGHGLWCLVAAMVRGVSGSPPAGGTTRRECPACHASMPADSRSCASCGWSPAVQRIPPLRALENLTGQVDRLHRLGSLDDLSFEQLNDTLQTELQRVRAQVEQDAAARREAAQARQAAVGPASIFESKQESMASAPGTAPVVVRSTKVSEPGAADTPPAEVVPVPTSRTWAQLLDGFMEERNLRWGELIGGLLIVCGSIALVSSFWGQIEKRPFLQFFVFNGFTAALFGAGAYAERRLRLPTTSRGIYSIATLLVPLNFLALAAYSRDSAADSVLTIAGELVSIALFAWLTYFAGRTTTPRAALLQAIGVIGPSIAALLVRRFVHPDSGLGVLYGLGSIPVAFYISAAAGSLWRSRGLEDLSESEAHSQFRFLGVTTFAAVLPLGLLAFRTGDVTGTLRWLAPFVSLAAAPGLATGLFLWKRIKPPAHVGLRTAGSAVAVAGVLILLAGVALAWPHPAVTMFVALISFGVLSGLAVTQRIPAAHLLALPCLGLAYLISVHATRGATPWHLGEAGELRGALLSAASGTALLPLSLVFGGLAAWLRRLTRDESRFFGLVAALSAGLSLALVTWFGLGRDRDPGGATWVYGIYAVALLTVAAVVERRGMSLPDERTGLGARAVACSAWAGAGLLLVAAVQGAVFNFGESLDLRHPWLLALIGHATALACAAAIVGWPGLDQREGPVSGVARILTTVAVVTSCVGAVCLASIVPAELPGQIARYALWLSAVWCALAWLRRSPQLFAAFQASTTSAVVFAVAAVISRQPWAVRGRDVWLDPWSWQLQGAALVLLGLCWAALRLALRRSISQRTEDDSSTVRERPWVADALALATPRWPQFDRVAGWIVLAAMVAMSVYGAVPGVAQELSPRGLAVALESARGVAVPATGRVVPLTSHFELAGIPHQHALEFGAWVWLGLVVVLFVTWQVEENKLQNRAGVVIALSAACSLLAGRWESDVAAASALRWASALFLAAASASMWLRAKSDAAQLLAGPPLPLGEGSGVRAPRIQTRLAAVDSSGWLTALVLVVSAAPLAAMGLFVGTAAVWQYALDDAHRTTFVVLLVLSVIAVPVGVALRAIAAQWIARLPAETVLATAAAARQRAGGMRQAGGLVWILGIGPLLAVGLFIVSAALKGNPIVGPNPNTLFHWMGLAASYAIPVAICALTLVGYAVRERSTGFAFAAGLLFNVSATAAYLLLAARGGLKLDTVLWVRLAQLNAAVSSGFGLLWMAAAKYGAVRQHEADALAASEAGRPLLRVAGIPIPGLLVTQSLIGVSLMALVLVPSALGLFLSQRSFPALLELAEPLGRTAWFLTLTGAFALSRLAGMRPAPGVVCAAVWSLAMLATSYFSRWEGGEFHAYRVMLAAHAAAGWVLLVGLMATADPQETDPAFRRRVARWTTFLGGLAVLLACRHIVATEGARAAAATVVSIAALGVALSCFSKRRGFLYATGALASLAQSIWWLHVAQPAHRFETDWPGLLDANVVAWFLPAFASLIIERWLIVPAEDRESHFPPATDFGGVGFHRLAGVAAILCLAISAAAGLINDAGGMQLNFDASHRWQALACAVAIVGACLWDPRSTAPAFGLYLLGVVAGAAVLDRLNLEPRLIAWNGTLVLAGYALVSALLWRGRHRVVELARACRIPGDADSADRAERWLIPATRLLCAVVLVAAIGIDLSFAERGMRLTTGTAALFGPLAIGLLARPGARDSLFGEALFAGVVGSVVWSWAWITPGELNLMHRFVVMTAASAAMTALYGLAPSKLLPEENDWARAATRMTPRLCVLTLGSVLLVMLQEASYFTSGAPVSMAWPAIVVMSVTILGLVVAALTAALVPGRDPLGLSERGRTAYVYAAEALLALLFLHKRFTMPWLFHGFFIRYWPFIVMLIAFVGVWISEIFRRQRRMVLAEPLERTGAFLPILPLLGFWAIPNQGHYSLVLLTAGGIYSVLSLLRRSFVFGLLAALAANGGLWYYLQHVGGYGFFDHPQLWMIPFALCVLGAAYLNREQLSPEQMATIRYLTSITIYVSSTSDIFINGVKQAPWLPVVLAGLSVAGILVGIMLRVRAFLFLGTGFLTLAMLTIIWHAAVDLHHTWLIWLTVVIAGVLILGIFAIFEKKRQEILEVVDRLRAWEP